MTGRFFGECSEATMAALVLHRSAPVGAAVVGAVSLEYLPRLPLPCSESV